MEESCGSGSQGNVVLAKLNGEEVCVKVFGSAKVFAQELKMLTAAQKTGVVPLIKGAHSSDKGHLIIMSYHGKTTLESFLSSQPHPKKIHRILGSLNTAIQALHKYGIIHNDIKENNILINCQNMANEVVTVIDFGWSTYSGESPYPHLNRKQIKEFPWIAPWLAHGGKASTLSDLYSLGYLILSISEKYSCPAYSIFGNMLTSYSHYNFSHIKDAHNNEIDLKFKYIMKIGLKEIRPMLSAKACSKCAITEAKTTSRMPYVSKIAYFNENYNKGSKTYRNSSKSWQNPLLNFPLTSISFLRENVLNQVDQNPIELVVERQNVYQEKKMNKTKDLYAMGHISPLTKFCAKSHYQPEYYSKMRDPYNSNTPLSSLFCNDLREERTIV